MLFFGGKMKEKVKLSSQLQAQLPPAPSSITSFMQSKLNLWIMIFLDIMNLSNINTLKGVMAYTRLGDEDKFSITWSRVSLSHSPTGFNSVKAIAIVAIAVHWVFLVSLSYRLLFWEKLPFKIHFDLLKAKNSHPNYKNTTRKFEQNKHYVGKSSMVPVTDRNH